VRRPLLLVFALSVSAPAAAALLPGDVAKGKALHAAQCTGCHDASVYTRAKRRVGSVEGLIGQVKFCNEQMNKNLSRDQLNDLVRFLNESYYKFD